METLEQNQQTYGATISLISSTKMVGNLGKICFNGNSNCHHQPAPRGSISGTQGLKGNYERSKIPQELCEEIINSVNN